MVALELDLRRAGAIDWTAPWFSAIAADGRAVATADDMRTSLNAVASRRGILNSAQQPVRFGAADAAGGAAYEAHIGRTGEVPTRDNLHDFFNALVWLAFPRIKARLNALQAAAMAAASVGSRRGRLRDAATLIDENAVLVITERADLVEALGRHAWRTLFVDQRAAWHGEVRPLVFGHALMEKLVAPYRGLTAHALVVPLAPDASLAAVDAWVADELDATMEPRRLLPLPVLGIPGWADNADPAYYDDTSVFRPARTERASDVQPQRG